MKSNRTEKDDIYDAATRWAYDFVHSMAAEPESWQTFVAAITRAVGLEGWPIQKVAMEGRIADQATEIKTLAARVRELEKPFEVFEDDVPKTMTAPEIVAKANEMVNEMAGRCAERVLEIRVQELERIAGLEAENAALREAGAKVFEGFERRLFIRDISFDASPSWAIRIAPYLAALAALSPEDISAERAAKMLDP